MEPAMRKVLVVDDKQVMRDSVAATLQRAGYQVVAAADAESAIALIERHRPAAVLTDLKMPDVDGLGLLERIRERDPQLPVVLMTAYGSVDAAVSAMKLGAFDFIQKPFAGDQLTLTVRRAVERSRLLHENEALKREKADASGQEPALIGGSPVMQRLARVLDQVAQSQATVLISGESGTGKEVVARALHARGPRRDRVMLCVNCAALSSSLLESELFGHEKGAFTGADQTRKGRFELADGGTLLLDEVSEIGPDLQAKLLRVLQERQFERVGSSSPICVDVRLIATSNRDLPAEVASGAFRQDLYYRLNVVPVHLPPLRDRLEDVPALAEHFLARVDRREGRADRAWSPAAVALMQQYPWPGNVRELQNICERAAVLCADTVIPLEVIQPWLSGAEAVSAPRSVGHAPPSGRRYGPGALPAQAAWVPIVPALAPRAPQEVAVSPGAFEAHAPAPAIEPWSEAPAPGAPASGTMTLADMEREQVLRTLARFGGNRQRTARALGIGLRTLGLKLKRWKELHLVPETV